MKDILERIDEVIGAWQTTWPKKKQSADTEELNLKIKAYIAAALDVNPRNVQIKQKKKQKNGYGCEVLIYNKKDTYRTRLEVPYLALES